jgi:parvulin-like peptidyl-prolyl isomerase
MYVKSYFKNNPNFQTDGRFDESKWQAALNSPNIPWVQIEAEFRSQLPITKLEQIIRSAAYVGEAEVEKLAAEELTKFTTEQLGVRFSEFRGDEIKIEPSEIEAYYDSHKNEFRQDEMRKMQYAYIKLEPTKEDTLLVYKNAVALADRVKNGEDISSLAKIYSDEPGAKDSGGDLGWFTRGRMVKPFEDAAFSAKEGEVVGPVKTRFGYHVIKITGRKVNDKGEEEVKATHILLKITPSRATEDNAYAQINALVEAAKEKDFAEAASELGIELKQTNYFSQKAKYLPGVGNVPGAIPFAFASEEGTVSRVYQTPSGYYLFYLSEIKPEGYRTLEEVKNTIERRLRNEKSAELAEKFLNQKIKPLIDSGKSLKEISQMDFSKKLNYLEKSTFSLKDGIPGGVGKAPKAYARIVKYEVGKISGPLSGNSASYFVNLLDKKVPDEQELQSKKELIRKRLLQTRQAQYFQKWYEQKLKEADVKDYRADFNLI